jgi:hypothetical protein
MVSRQAMIRREADEIRVERDAWRVVVGSTGMIALALVLGVIFIGSAIDSRKTQAIGLSALVLVAMGALVAHQVLRPDVLIIRPNQIGYAAGKELRWISRSSFDRVKVVLNMFGSDVLLMSAEGKTVHRLAPTQLIVKDLRRAFTEAGYAVEGWTGPKRA